MSRYDDLAEEEHLTTMRMTDDMQRGANTRRCGLKILSPPSYVVLPDDTTTQYLSTFQPSEQAHVLPGNTR